MVRGLIAGRWKRGDDGGHGAADAIKVVFGSFCFVLALALAAGRAEDGEVWSTGRRPRCACSPNGRGGLRLAFERGGGETWQLF